MMWGLGAKEDLRRMGARYEDTLKEKVLAITADTLIVGVNIAKLCSGRGSPSSGDWSTARP